MKNINKVDCPYCDGDGEIMDSRRITGRSIDPPMMNCPECRGTGWVYEDDADNIDLDKTIADYDAEDRATAAEARWEWENER